MPLPAWVDGMIPPGQHPPQQQQHQQQHATMDASLRSLVYYYLDTFMYTNAVFLCERLVASDPREENVLLLATCHVREGCELRGHSLLQGCRLPQSRFMLAHCCVVLGRLEEAERVLLAGTKVMQKGPKECREEILSDPCPIPNGAAGLRLLGLACQGVGRRESAEEYFRLCLELDPLMWVSVASLCELGADLDVEAHFRRDVKKIAAAATNASKGSCFSIFGADAVAGRALANGSSSLPLGGVDCPTCSIRKRYLAEPLSGQPGAMMPPPPPRTPGTAGLRYDGTPVRFAETEGKNRGGPVRGDLFGTPTPGQRGPARQQQSTGEHAGQLVSAWSKANDVANASVFLTPAYMTPFASTTVGGSRGRPRGAAAGGAAQSSGSVTWAEASGKSVGHLLDLGTRLGTFYPPAEGPGGPAPAVSALLDGAVHALRTVKEDPPAPWYDANRGCALAGDVSGYRDGATGVAVASPLPGTAYTYAGDRSAAAAATTATTGPRPQHQHASEAGTGRRVGAHLFATPGLTPIHPAQQTPDLARHYYQYSATGTGIGDGGAGAGANDLAVTPSTFLSGLLRSPDTAAFADAAARLETPAGAGTGAAGAATSGLEEEGARGLINLEATRMAAAGLGTSAMREVGTGGTSGVGGGGGAEAGMGMGGRVARGGGGGGGVGGRRVGGRLSFSSPVGPEDVGNGGEAGGGGGGERSEVEERVSKRVVRAHVSRGHHQSTATATASSRKPATGTTRAGMRPPSQGGAVSTPTSASIAGRTSRSSTAAAAAAVAAAAAAAAAGAVPPGRAAAAGAGAGAVMAMDVESPVGGSNPMPSTGFRGESGHTPAPRRRLASAREKLDSAAGAGAGTGTEGGGDRGQSTSTSTAAGTSAPRRSTRATTSRQQAIDAASGVGSSRRRRSTAVGAGGGEKAVFTPQRGGGAAGSADPTGYHPPDGPTLYSTKHGTSGKNSNRLHRFRGSAGVDALPSSALRDEDGGGIVTESGVMGGAGGAEGRRRGGGSARCEAPAAASGVHDGGGDDDDGELRLTRAEWECLQWDETISFALNYACSASATNGEMAEQPGDREALLASIAVRQAAHATHRAVAAAAAGGVGEEGEEWAEREGMVVPKSSPTAGGGPRASPPLRGWGKGQAGNQKGSARRAKPAGKGKEGGRRVKRKDGVGAGGGGGGGAGGGGEEVAPGMREVAALLAILSKGYQLLTKYRCTEALKELERLPPQHYCTGWVQHQVGRAYFERADYPRAKTALESMQRYAPHRIEGLDLLSTTLWHLKKEVELSYLAQKVSEFDRLSPYTWCVVGNCFSLQKEHETALRFFQRAIQVDGDFTYAYTLCGHEYVANEDFDKAVACYRMAIRTDRRHYNAWYGLGSIYHRQEKYDMAEYHFRRALSINPQSSVLRVYLGMVLHSNKRYLDALDMLELASNEEPSNPQASFQRAHVLMSMEKYEDALRELEVVRDNVPKESAVYFLMGKVCKKLGKTDAAMRHFTIALDLHNKDKNLIKAAVDRLNEPDLDEEEKF